MSQVEVLFHIARIYKRTKTNFGYDYEGVIGGRSNKRSQSPTPTVTTGSFPQ